MDRDECDDQMQAYSPEDAAIQYANAWFTEDAMENISGCIYENTLEVRKYSPNRKTKIHRISIRACYEIDFYVTKGDF